MVQLGISNLAWSPHLLDEVLEQLPKLGIDGIEIAPRALWATSPNIDEERPRRLRHDLKEKGLEVSGLQSLLYGTKDLQILDKECWPTLLNHLERTTQLANELGAGIMVFGSPKNRIRGSLSTHSADQRMAGFLSDLLPSLDSYELILTIEPNAPAYGADYLTTYPSVIALVDNISSPYIQPQVDTGCLLMVGEDPANAIRRRIPAHIHISAPNLGPPSSTLDPSSLVSAIQDMGYSGWLVLEMLPSPTDELATVMEEASWLINHFGELREGANGSKQ